MTEKYSILMGFDARQQQWEKGSTMVTQIQAGQFR